MLRRTRVCKGLMLAFGGSLALGAAPAFAQQQLERVEITGSSIRRVDAETALPVTVIRVDELQKQGITTAEQALTRLAHCVLTANIGIPHRSIREAIALAIHVVVHIARVNDRRRVTEVMTVRGYDSEAERFLLEPYAQDHAFGIKEAAV